MNQILEVGDIVALKDGREVEVLSIKKDYSTEGGFIRFDYLNRKEDSPMRRTAYPSDMVRIIRKNQINKMPDPKERWPHDVKDDGKDPLPVTVVSQEQKTQVHEPVPAPVKTKKGK